MTKTLKEEFKNKFGKYGLWTYSTKEGRRIWARDYSQNKIWSWFETKLKDQRQQLEEEQTKKRETWMHNLGELLKEREKETFAKIGEYMFINWGKDGLPFSFEIYIKDWNRLMQSEKDKAKNKKK